MPTCSVSAFLDGHRRETFPDGLFRGLFPSRRGRPSLPAEVIVSVVVLQPLHDFSDAEAMDALLCDLRWKVACGPPIDHAGFHPMTLTVSRNRLRASTRPERILRGSPGHVGPGRGAARQDPPGGGLGGTRRRGGRPGHRHPTDHGGAAARRQVPGAAELVAQSSAHTLSGGGQHRRERRITNKVTKTTPHERSSPQNGMPEPVPYVYRQQNRRNDWAGRIARPNAEVWWPTAVSAPEPKANARRRPLIGIMRALDSFTARGQPVLRSSSTMGPQDISGSASGGSGIWGWPARHFRCGVAACGWYHSAASCSWVARR